VIWKYPVRSSNLKKKLRRNLKLKLPVLNVKALVSTIKAFLAVSVKEQALFVQMNMLKLLM